MGGLLGALGRMEDSRKLRAEYDRRHRVATVAMPPPVPRSDMTEWTRTAKRACREHGRADRCWARIPSQLRQH